MDAEDPDRARDVLDGLVAEILEAQIFQAIADLIADRAGNADAAGLGQRLQAGRDVDAVAEDVGTVNDHVAKIDADAKLHPARRRDVGVALRHPALNLGRAQHRIDDAMKFDQQAVAGGLDDAAAILGDGRIDQLDAMGFEARKGARLVSLHQAAIADHVGGEDRSEPALWSWHVHLNDLPGYLAASVANPGISPKPRQEARQQL
ncbi:hypothetical protein ACVW0V_005401 [Bradyrhizobium elkanii]